MILRCYSGQVYDLQFCFGGDWGFGQDRQERKCAFELNIVVDVIGQYVLNARGGGRMRRSWDEERRQRGEGWPP